MRTAARRQARRALQRGACAPCEHAPSLPPWCAEAAIPARAAGGGYRFGASPHAWRGFSAGPSPPPPNGPETPPESGDSGSEPEEVRAHAARGAGGCTVTVSSRALADAAPERAPGFAGGLAVEVWLLQRAVLVAAGAQSAAVFVCVQEVVRVRCERDDAGAAVASACAHRPSLQSSLAHARNAALRILC